MTTATHDDRIQYIERKERFYEAELDERLRSGPVHDLVRDVTQLFHDVGSLDNDARELWFDGAAYDEGVEARIAALYARWVRLAERLLELVTDVGGTGRVVAAADDLRHCLTEGRAIVGPEPERLTDLGARYRDAAVEESRAGQATDGLIDA